MTEIHESATCTADNGQPCFMCGWIEERQQERQAVERHNAYSYIKPNAPACHRCGRKAYVTPVDGFVVQPCDNCQQEVCERCADTNADCDQDGYFLTSWTCKDGCRKGDLSNGY